MPRVALLAVCLLALAAAEDAVSNPGPPPPPPPHLLLLLDASASMASQNRLEKIHVALRGWIENLVPEGVVINLWKFTYDAMEIISTLIDDSPNSRQEIINYIPEGTSGSSCIACAIETVLKHVNKTALILLITDGNDKFLEEDLENLMKKLEESQCRIISILIGNSYTNIHLLNELSEGSINHVADENAVLGLLDALQAAVLTVKNYTTSVNIFEEELSSSESHFFSTFNIDSSLINHNVCINLYYWPHDMALAVNLTKPSGDNQQMIGIQSKFGYMKHCQLNTMGEWRIHIFSPTFNKFVALQVTANKIERDIGTDIEFHCWVETGESTLSLCGAVNNGKYFTNIAKISVDIIAEDGVITKQDLIEIYPGNGDIQPQEYLYTRKHLNVNKAGYYSARCWVDGQLFNASDTVINHQHFARVAWAGTFKVDKIYPQAKVPTRIKDLNILQNVDMKGCILLLEFTAPSNALKYKLVLSSSLYDVISSEGLILSTVPGVAGTKENIIFTVPSQYHISPVPLYIAVKAMREKEESELSNIVYMQCHINKTKLPLSEANQISNVTTVSTISLPQDATFTGSVVTQNDNQSTAFPTQIPHLSTISARHNYNSSATVTEKVNNSSVSLTTLAYELSILPTTSEYNLSHNKSVSVTTQIYNVTPTTSSNTTDYIHKDLTNNENNSISVLTVIGIVVGVCFVIAVIGKLIQHIIYTRKRYGAYEVSYRQSIRLKASTAKVHNQQQP